MTVTPLKKAGPADLILRRDRTHLVRADHCELEDGIITCLTELGIRSWPACEEIVEVRWRDHDHAVESRRAA